MPGAGPLPELDRCGEGGRTGGDSPVYLRLGIPQQSRLFVGAYVLDPRKGRKHAQTERGVHADALASRAASRSAIHSSISAECQALALSPSLIGAGKVGGRAAIRLYISDLERPVRAVTCGRRWREYAVEAIT